MFNVLSWMPYFTLVLVFMLSGCQEPVEHDWFLAVYPVPTQQRLAVTYKGNNPTEATLEFVSANGSILHQEVVQSSSDFQILGFQLDVEAAGGVHVVLKSDDVVLESTTAIKVNP